MREFPHLRNGCAPRACPEDLIQLRFPWSWRVARRSYFRQRNWRSFYSLACFAAKDRCRNRRSQRYWTRESDLLCLFFAAQQSDFRECRKVQIRPEEWWLRLEYQR